MKLIKFIAAAALVASTSLVSGGNAVPAGVSPQIAACYNWPHCRDVNINEQTSEQRYIAACYNWPHCRDVNVIEQTFDVAPQVQTKTVRKAV